MRCSRSQRDHILIPLGLAAMSKGTTLKQVQAAFFALRHVRISELSIRWLSAIAKAKANGK